MFAFLQLALVANASLFLACRVLGYGLPVERKAIAATTFALLYSLPLPIGAAIHLLPPVALWFLLGHPDAPREDRTAVFLLTYLFAALATLVLFELTH